MLPIEAQALIRSAFATTGLTKLGDDRFMAGLERLTQSINAEVRFSPHGRDAMFERLERLIINRVRFAADLAAHPEILDEALHSPVVILGLPRVGSTKLHRMLAASGSFQELLFWQVFNPARIQGPSGGEDPRIGLARRYVEWRNATVPAANLAHRIDVQIPEEETFLLEFSFRSIYPMSFVGASGYYRWTETIDHRDTYNDLARLLKYLQWQFYPGEARSWVLKSPLNLGYESEIQRFAPDARFVMLHRDPVTTVASVAALVKQSRLLYCAEVDPAAIGRWCLHEFSAAAGRHVAWRRAHLEAPVLDLAYRDVEQAPMEVVDRVYRFLGVPLTREVETSIADWLSADSQRHDQRHVYSLEACGLTAAEITDAFAGYGEFFKDYIGARA